MPAQEKEAHTRSYMRQGMKGRMGAETDRLSWLQVLLFDKGNCWQMLC